MGNKKTFTVQIDGIGYTVIYNTLGPRWYDVIVYGSIFPHTFHDQQTSPSQKDAALFVGKYIEYTYTVLDN